MKQLTVTPLQQPITAEITLPGCIGYTIRALNIAAMTKGSVSINNPLKSDDTSHMFNALKTLGIAVEEKENAFIVHGDISDVVEKEYQIDIGLSGRTARSILGLLTIVPGTKIVTCQEPFKKRPIGDLVDGLRQLGAKIEYLENDGHLPVKILTSSIKTNTAKMTGNLSSQYFSSLMMIAPVVGGLTIDVIGEQSSKPFIDMTSAIMKDFGVTVENKNYKQYIITPEQHYTNPKIYTVEPEATAASYFFAIAALTKSTIRILHLDPHSAQGDIIFADVLEKMGCLVKKNEQEKWIEVTGTEILNGIEVDMNATPDLVPTLAVVAAFAKGKTTITDIAHVRLKESDRIAAPQTELAKMGIKTEANEDTFTIFGGEPKAAIIDTYHDHRIAMSFAAAGSIISGMKINNPAVVTKSFPDFWGETYNYRHYTKGGTMKIMLIGFMGSGKTTIAKLLAKKLNMERIDMDEMIIKKSNRKSDKEIFEKDGEIAFREIEITVAKELRDKDNVIIATGGGVVMNKIILDYLRENSTVIFLKNAFETAHKRISKNPPPLFRDTEKAKALYALRLPLYEYYANMIIETDNRTPEEVVEEVIKYL